jgi:hypothetical protein
VKLETQAYSAVIGLERQLAVWTADEVQSPVPKLPDPESPAPSRRQAKEKKASSPAATGPAGALLEGHVGAQYLLPLLTGGEARGLPGVLVTRVGFQGASLGHPMDDIVITGVDSQGRPGTLEVQAKRTLAFTASDVVFAEVVALACRAAAKPEFLTTRYELAVAVGRSSTKIEQYIQVLLRWARDYQDAAAFFERVSQKGVAHQDMRDFVAAFRHNMRAAGAPNEDDDVWRLLSRFQVLVFDFEQPGSICAQWARDRCAAALSAADASRATGLWDSLQQIALEIDAVGGDLDSSTLRHRLTSEREYRLAGDRRMHAARGRLAEAASHTLDPIRSTVNNVHVDRTEKVVAVLGALEHGRYLEIRGAGGVGKSAVLKAIRDLIAAESRVMVLAPNRVPPGGWAALRAQLDCDCSARELLIELAGDGGGILLIDGIDRFDDLGQRNTVVDLLQEAARVPGFRVVATARTDFDADARAWLPGLALQMLSEAPAVVVEELDDDEVIELRRVDPALAALLRPGHPAEKLVRNLYRLDRLARSGVDRQTTVFSEAQMAAQWWNSGDGATPVDRLDRQRVLRTLAIHLLNSSAPMDTSALPSQALTALVASESLRQLTAVRAQPVHDVLGDWAIGCLLFDEPERIPALPLAGPAPVRLARGAEIAARLHAELGSDAHRWRAMLAQVSAPGAHGSWRRAVLLALVRSERSADALNRCLPDLGESDAPLIEEIIRAAIVVDSQQAAKLWAALGVDTSKFTDDFAIPFGPAWLNLIDWSLENSERLSLNTVPQFVELYARWCNAFVGQDARSPLLVKRMYGWLVAAEIESNPRTSSLESVVAAVAARRPSLSNGQRSDLRRAFLAWSKLCPAETASYLKALADHPHRDVVFRELLAFVGTAPQAAPQAVADLFLQILPGGDDRRSSRDLLPHWDLDYFPATPARAPFLDLLLADKNQGLRLIRGLVARAVRKRSGSRTPSADLIEIQFPDGPRTFPWRQSYMMSRSGGSSIVESALMALEAWAHVCVERGEQFKEVISDVLGPDGSPAAYLLVAVDVLLSQWSKSRDFIWPFAASAELLVLDRQRLLQDQLSSQLPVPWVRPEPVAAVRLDDLRSRPSRNVSLEAVLGHFALEGPPLIRESLRTLLESDSNRLGAPADDAPGLNDPSLMAVHALNRLDPANYTERSSSTRTKTFQYISPADEAARFARLRQYSEPGYIQTMLIAGLTQAIGEASCPNQMLQQAVAWAVRDPHPEEAPTDDVDQDMVDRGRLIAAALVFRDGSPDIRAAHGAWAARQLDAAASENKRDRSPQQLPYNRSAITAVGLLAAFRHSPDAVSPEHLLNLAAQQTTDIVGVLRLELDAKRPLATELTRSLVRLALSSAIYAVQQRNDDNWERIDDYRAHHEAQQAVRKRADELKRRSAVEAEIAWLAGQGAEPDWPALPPPNQPQARRGLRIGADLARLQEPTPAVPRSFALDDAAAAGVMTLAAQLWQVDNPALLGTLVSHAWSWTAAANGVGVGTNVEPGERAYAWNQAYFSAALAAAVGQGPKGIQTFVLEPLAQLPEERFFVAAEATLRALDLLWLGDHAINSQDAMALREAVIQRLQATWHWRQLATDRSPSIASDAAGAVATTFMNDYILGQLKCYVLPPGMARVDYVLPLLARLAEEAAGSTFVALAMLGLLEVDPHPGHVTALARLVAAWWLKQGADAAFWIDYGIGKRVCDLIDRGVLSKECPIEVLAAAELTSIIDILVQSGTPLARALDERVAARRGAG